MGDRKVHNWPGSLEDGDTKIILAEQAEELNRTRGDFPLYEQAMKRAKENLTSTQYKCSFGLAEEFPHLSATVKAASSSLASPRTNHIPPSRVRSKRLNHTL